MREASANHVDEYVTSIWTTLQEVQVQSVVEACQQKRYYDRKLGTVNLKPGTWY